VKHPSRDVTLGICIHNTYGSRAGDLTTLTSGKVDCHFYITKTGEVFQMLPLHSKSWTAMSTANSNSIHIEHEGKREVAWTQVQFNASVGLVAWLCRYYKIPVRHVNPPADWRGLYDHRDLSDSPKVDGNDHGDGVPVSFPGWERYLRSIKNVSPGRITMRQRLMRAGFGPKSAEAIASGKAKAPKRALQRLIRAGFGEKSAKKLVGYDGAKGHQ
jgi:hypothetical protein